MDKIVRTLDIAQVEAIYYINGEITNATFTIKHCKKNAKHCEKKLLSLIPSGAKLLDYEVQEVKKVKYSMTVDRFMSLAETE